MGLPALDMTATARSSRPALRAVASRPKSRRGAAAAGSRAAFNFACLALVALALFGLGRVMLAAKATEAAIRSGELRTSIKAERLVGDQLEVNRSALTVPSRIESIAGVTMEMGEADSVAYMELPGDYGSAPSNPVPDGVGAGAEVSVQTPSEHDGLADMLASVMQMAAGEAQVLLVGDVGLATTE